MKCSICLNTKQRRNRERRTNSTKKPRQSNYLDQVLASTLIQISHSKAVPSDLKMTENSQDPIFIFHLKSS